MPNLFATDDKSAKDAVEQEMPSAMAPLPPEEDRIFDTMLEKQVTAGQLGWQMRNIILTNNALLFARPGNLSPKAQRLNRTLAHSRTRTHNRRLEKTIDAFMQVLVSTLASLSVLS